MAQIKSQVFVIGSTIIDVSTVKLEQVTKLIDSIFFALESKDYETKIFAYELCDCGKHYLPRIEVGSQQCDEMPEAMHEVTVSSFLSLFQALGTPAEEITNERAMMLIEAKQGKHEFS